MRHFIAVILLGLFAPLLAGCGGVTDALGFGRNPPDEFAVVDRPPLSLPPDYDLRPPRPGAPRPQEVHASQGASKLMFGPDARLPNTGGRDVSRQEATAVEVAGTKGEKALLEASGAAQADPAIRDIVDRETSQKVTGSRHLVDELLWWREKPAEGMVLDAEAEAQRLKEAREKGEPLNSGSTPVIERRKSGWLGM